MAKARLVEMKPEIRAILTSFSNSRSLPSGITTRSKILLMCSDGMSNTGIAENLHVDVNTVSTWRNRYIKARPYLDQVADNKEDNDHMPDIKDALMELLEDRPRSGKPPKFTEDQVLGIQKLSHENPRDHGVEATQWSLNLLKKEAQKSGLVESISPSTIRSFIQREKRSPDSPGSSPTPRSRRKNQNASKT